MCRGSGRPCSKVCRRPTAPASLLRPRRHPATRRRPRSSIRAGRPTPLCCLSSGRRPRTAITRPAARRQSQGHRTARCPCRHRPAWPRRGPGVSEHATAGGTAGRPLSAHPDVRPPGVGQRGASNFCRRRARASRICDRGHSALIAEYQSPTRSPPPADLKIGGYARSRHKARRRSAVLRASNVFSTFRRPLTANRARSPSASTMRAATGPVRHCRRTATLVTRLVDDARVPGRAARHEQASRGQRLEANHAERFVPRSHQHHVGVRIQCMDGMRGMTATSRSVVARRPKRRR